MISTADFQKKLSISRAYFFIKNNIFDIISLYLTKMSFPSNIVFRVLIIFHGKYSKYYLQDASQEFAQDLMSNFLSFVVNFKPLLERKWTYRGLKHENSKYFL